MYEILEEVETIVDKLGTKLNGQYGVIQTTPINPYDINNGPAAPVKQTTINGVTITYEDDKHIYFFEQQGKRIPMLSVTTLFGLFHAPFDTEEKAYNCALKRVYETNCLDKTGWDSLSVEGKKNRIKHAWKQNNIEATSYGTAAHMACEYSVIYPDWSISQIMEHILRRNGEKATRPIIPTFVENLKPVIAGFTNLGYVPVAEPVITDLELGVAGQSDLAMFNHQKKTIWILDYKTNKRKPGTDRAFEKMTGIFSMYDKVPLIEYNMQLSYYAIMCAMMYPGYTIEGITILWLDPEDGTIHPVPVDFSYWGMEVQRMRVWFKENQIPQRAYSNLSCIN